MVRKFSDKRMIKFVILVMLLTIVTLACSLFDLTGWSFGGDETKTTDPSVSTLTSIPISQPSIGPGDFTPSSPIGQGSTATGVGCLPGTWHIDHPSVINYMTLTMFGVGEFDFTPLTSGGKLELQIIPGQVILLAEDFKVDMGVNIGGVANVNINNVYVHANGQAAYLATDSIVNLTSISYNAMGTLESSTGSFSVDLDDLLTIARTFGFARSLELPVQSTKVSYICSGDILTIVVNKYASVTFNRTN